jgi:replicative DNA helicase
MDTPNTALAKVPTGILGLDDILGGGLPRGRPTLICGGAGCGKTLLAMEFLVRGAIDQDEPEVFVAFLKSRGMAHSNQTREFLITDQGVVLRDVYVGPGGVLTGSARLTQEAEEEAARLVREQEIERQRCALERQRARLAARIAELQDEFAAHEAETLALIAREQAREMVLSQGRAMMARNRQADGGAPSISAEGYP